MANLRHAHLGELLNRAYELEGLLLLALSRHDNDEHISDLVTSKIYEMADFTAEWDRSSLDTYRSRSASALDEENSSYSLEDELEEEDECCAGEPAAESDTEVNLEEEAEAAVAEEEAEADTYIPSDEESTPVPELSATSNEETSPEEIDTRFIAEVFGPHDNPECPATEELTNPDLAVAAEVTAVEGVAVTKPAVKSPQPRPVISINDRYRFTRALFHNSRKEFEDNLNIISQMENYDEAEDYFLNELEWNPEDQDVRLFMDIIHRYFDALSR